MTVELVARLREVGRGGEWKAGRHLSTAHPMCKEAADLIETQAAEIERLTKWRPIETAPDDDWFLAAIEVRHKNGGHWWEYHVVWLDDETGDIHTDCEQGWSISDYSRWIAVPDVPYPLNPSRNALEPKP
jgi:hypothetical protein